MGRKQQKAEKRVQGLRGVGRRREKVDRDSRKPRELESHSLAHCLATERNKGTGWVLATLPDSAQGHGEHAQRPHGLDYHSAPTV